MNIRESAANGLFLLSSLATVAAWQDQVEWGLKILAALVAIISGIAAFFYYRAKTRNIRNLRGRD